MSGGRCFWRAVVVAAGVCGAGRLALADADAAAKPETQLSPNLADATRGASVTASSEVGRLRGKDHRAATVIDGQIGDGYWCTAFTTKAPHWLEVKLAGPKRFNEVVLHVYEQSSVRSCRVERWDGKAWVAVGQMASARRPAGGFSPAWEFSDAPAGILRCRFPTVTSDRVRFWFDKDGSVRLYEVEVLESPDKASGGPAAVASLDRSAPLVRIALGPRGGAAMPGWLAVGATSRYTPKQGIGWLGEGTRADCDRCGGATFARGFVAGWGGAGRLRLDLPAGRYVAALFAADFMLPVRPFQVESAGLKTGQTLATVSPGAWEARRFRVEAGPQGVELTFRGDVCWRVNALVIAPESNLNALLAEADRLEEELALGSPEWMKKREMVKAPAPAKALASEADRARGYVFFPSEPAARVYPTTRPDAQQVGRPVAIQATPGESAAATLGVVPLRALFDMRLACTDLARSGAAPIPASAIDLRVVRCWPQIDKTPAGRGKVQVIPELLEAQSRHPAVCAPEGATRQYWITVRVPDGAAPGEYRGELRFSAEGVAPAVVPVEVTVLPFRLQTPPEKTFFMYSILGDFTDDEIRPLLRDMREHGMTSLASDLAGKWAPKTRGSVPEFDAESLRRVLRLAKEAGFTRPMPWGADGAIRGLGSPEGSDAWNRGLADLLGQVRKVQEEMGGQELLFYPVDEPFGNDERLTLAERSMRVARQTRSLRTYCTPAHGDIARLGSLLDVRCYAIGSVPDVHEAAADTRKAGAAFWWYTNAARELPDVRRYLAGAWFWSTGAEGQGYWCYQSRWRRTRPFQDLEGDLHAHDYVAYPDLDGPIPTVQWECIRMGIDDARYLYTLEAAIAAHRGTAPTAAAERFLAQLRAAMPKSVKLPDNTWVLYNCPWKPGEFSRLRRDVARHISEVIKN